MVSSNAVLHRMLVLLLGCIIFVHSSIPDQMKSTMDTLDAQKAGCDGLQCEENDNNIGSSENRPKNGLNTDSKSEEEQLSLSHGKVTLGAAISEEVLFLENTDNVKHSHTDPLPKDSSVSDSALVDSKRSSGLETSKSTESTTDASIPESSSDGDSQEDEEESGFPSLQVFGVKKSQSHTTSPDHATEEEPPKRKLFPFLYTSLFSTFRSLLRSILLEFVEDSTQQDGSANTSQLGNHSSLMADEEISNDPNATSNSTDPVKKTRFQCAIKNVTSRDIGKVKVVNSTELLDILSLSKSQKSSACVLVMFYAPWCHFCAQTAPHYNALARAYPQLDVLAVDTSHFSYLNARFGTVAVPNIMLFHSRSAVRFNHTHRMLDKFTQFVTNNTGLEPRRFVLLEPLDFVGPLPCVVKRNPDWLLWSAWVFVTACSAYGFVQSQYGQGFIARLKFLWQEHQHID